MTQSHIQPVNAHTVKQWIHSKEELALLDIREHGQFGEDHLFFAIPLPYSLLDNHAARLLPRLQVRIVIYGNADDTETVIAAAHALERLGYTHIHYLDGGIQAWKAAGYGTFAGVNLPSKTFGELIEHKLHTPSVSAKALHQWQSDPTKKVVVLDGRPINEFYKMNIPGATCCPNGELALRLSTLVPDTDTTVVINCAGRTRSIIGAQTLINLGVPNPVYALENGTQGWYLEDLPLEHKNRHHYPEQIDLTHMQAERTRATRLKEQHQISAISHAELEQLWQENTRSVFICDVRTQAEYQQSQWPSYVQHTPGGQLIQATDQYVGVRRGVLVLCDTDGIRAPVVASWLKQMGWTVYLLEQPEKLALPAQPALQQALPASVQTCLQAELPRLLEQTPNLQILDARSSMAFRQASLQGAQWTIRPLLRRQMAQIKLDQPILLLGNTVGVLQNLAQDLVQLGYQAIHLCQIDERQNLDPTYWQPHQQDPLNDEQCIDYLFFVHDRHDGNKEAARRYLEWETGLIAQLDEQERQEFLI